MLTKEQLQALEQPGVLSALREFAFSTERTTVSPEAFRAILSLLESTQMDPQKIIKEYEAAKDLS